MWSNSIIVVIANVVMQIARPRWPTRWSEIQQHTPPSMHERRMWELCTMNAVPNPGC